MKSLPRTVDPRKLASSSLSLEGPVCLSELERLLSVTIDGAGAGHAHCQLSFYRDESGVFCLRSEVSATLSLECQRCLGPISYPVEALSNIVIVWDEDQAKAVSRDKEAWIVADGEANLFDLIEDELLLALPPVVYHDYDCIEYPGFGANAGETAESEAQDVKESPFKILEKLKSKK